MSISKCTAVLILIMILSACSPGHFLGPTLTPTLTRTPSLTPTLTPTFTPLPTATSTPLPGLGITDIDLVSWAENFNYAMREITIEELPAREYVSPEGYTILILVGKTPHLEKVILEIDLAKENSLIATTTWIYVLEIASNHAGKPAADWVHDNYPKAAQSGREEKVFENANIILEVEESIFRLIIEPAIN